MYLIRVSSSGGGGGGGGASPPKHPASPPKKKEKGRKGKTEKERGRVYSSPKTMQYLCHQKNTLGNGEMNIVREIATPLPPQTKIVG